MAVKIPLASFLLVKCHQFRLQGKDECAEIDRFNKEVYRRVVVGSVMKAVATN